MKSSTDISLLSFAWSRVRSGYVWLLCLSFFINLLVLVPPLYMMQMSNRVLTSQNWTTLGFLFMIAVALVVIWSVLDGLRSRALRKIGMALDESLAPRVFTALARLGGERAKTQFLTVSNDFNMLRDLATGPLVISAFDAFWSPIFIVALFLIHPYFAALFIAILIVNIACTLITQIYTQAPSKNSQECNIRAHNFAGTVGRNADTARATGMIGALQGRWNRYHRASLGWQDQAFSRARYSTSISKFLSKMQVVLVVTIGVILVLQREVGAGSMFGAVILMRMSLGALDHVITSWRPIANARHQFQRIDQILRDAERRDPYLRLPVPEGRLAINRVTATAPDKDAPILHDVSFFANPGQVVAVVGPSGAGKSALAKVLMGIWLPRRGNVTIDGHDIAHWNPDALGPYIGYVPQEIEMFPGTVAENIARFGASGPMDPEAVMRSVEGAGILDLVQSLPEGLNTQLGPGGHVLSGGQRQRLALARAIYGNPRVVVMDEPNSNLDAASEQALGKTLEALRQANAAVVVITHKLSLLIYCDTVVVMNAGAVQAFGARDDIVSRLAPPRPAAKLTVIEGEGRVAIGEK